MHTPVYRPSLESKHAISIAFYPFFITFCMWCGGMHIPGVWPWPTARHICFYPISSFLPWCMWRGWMHIPCVSPWLWVKTGYPLLLSTHFFIIFCMWCGGMHIPSVSPWPWVKTSLMSFNFPLFLLVSFTFVVMSVWVLKVTLWAGPMIDNWRSLGTTGHIKIAGFSIVTVKGCWAALG